MVFALLMVGCGADQAVKKGDKFWAVGEYFDAAEQYKKAYTQTPSKERTTRGQRAKKLAECYRHLNQTNKAISAYNNVVRYKQADSLTHFYLGQLYMRNGNYKEAAKQFAIACDSLEKSGKGKEERHRRQGETVQAWILGSSPRMTRWRWCLPSVNACDGR